MMAYKVLRDQAICSCPHFVNYHNALPSAPPMFQDLSCHSHLSLAISSSSFLSPCSLHTLLALSVIFYTSLKVILLGKFFT